jgi:hypothetical protein
MMMVEPKPGDFHSTHHGRRLICLLFLGGASQGEA